MNANDSYWLPNPAQKLEGFARIIGCEKCQRTLRTRMVDRYVIDALAKRQDQPDRPARLRAPEPRDGRRGDVRRTTTSSRSARPPRVATPARCCARWDQHVQRRAAAATTSSRSS